MNKINNLEDSLIEMLKIQYFKGASDTTKSQRLYDTFLHLIEEQHISPGEKLPNEAILAKELPVGLATVQSAMRKLTYSGLVERRRKAGSFVAEKNKIGSQLSYFKFTSPDDSSPLPLTDINVSIKEIHEKGPWSDFLTHSERFIELERLMDVGGKFRITSRLYLELPKFESIFKLSPQQLEGVSLKLLIENEHKIKITNTLRKISYISLPSSLAKKLKARSGDLAIKYEIFETSLQSKPIMYQSSIIPPMESKLVI